MKRIAIFADGTWNSPVDGNATNVLQYARGIRSVAGDAEQVAFYDWGVGTDRKKLGGGISGKGIDKNILDCYRFIIHNYRRNDHLFFFGFSRGAYTVRSLAGLIRNCGVLKREHADKIEAAYTLYRRRSRVSSPGEDEATKFRRDYAVQDRTPIEFIGVWDTVGALGIPVPFLGSVGDYKYHFHDTEPSSIVKHARHAASIDENREDFDITPWDRKAGMDIKQVWFAGVHSDIGGGYEERGLSDCASEWMLREAAGFGLGFEPHLRRSIRPDPLDEQHNERRGIYLARGYNVRKIDGPLHKSVKQRWDADAHGYRTKSKAMIEFLESVGGDWSKVEIES